MSLWSPQDYAEALAVSIAKFYADNQKRLDTTTPECDNNKRGNQMRTRSYVICEHCDRPILDENKTIMQDCWSVERRGKTDYLRAGAYHNSCMSALVANTDYAKSTYADRNIDQLTKGLSFKIGEIKVGPITPKNQPTAGFVSGDKLSTAPVYRNF